MRTLSGNIASSEIPHDLGGHLGDGLLVDRALADVVRSGMFINGPKVTELEERLAEFVGTRRAVACGSGTDAQQLILMALGIGPGPPSPPLPFLRDGDGPGHDRGASVGPGESVVLRPRNPEAT